MTVPAIAAVLVAGLAVNHVSLLGGVAGSSCSSRSRSASLPFAALGLLIGYLFDADSAQGAMMVTLFGLAILGGLWAPISSFPDTLATIGRMLPSFRLADLGRDAVTGRAHRTSPTSPSWPSMPSSSAVWRPGATGPPSSAPVADDRPARTVDAPAPGASIADVFGAPSGREGSWIPAWRIAGAAFILYPIVRILSEPPEPIVTGLVLAATAAFALLVWAVARRDPMDPSSLEPVAGGPRSRHPRRSSRPPSSERPARAGSRCSITPRPPPACCCRNAVRWR